MTRYEINTAEEVFCLHEILHEDCLSCKEPITNPICPNCLFKGLKEWLESYPQLNVELSPILEDFLESQKSHHGKSARCIRCDKRNGYMCPYCFTEFVLKLLRDLCVGEEVLKDYLEFFNFDFGDFRGKWGYWREAEKLGVV